MQIVKYVKNWYIFVEVLLTLHVPRGNPQATFQSPARTILITLVFVLQVSDIWLPRYPPVIAPVLAIFAVSAHITEGISHGKAMGKMPLLQLGSCARYAPHRPGFATLHSPDMSAMSCENFSSLLAAVQAAGRPHWPHCVVADRQKHRRTPRNLVN